MLTPGTRLGAYEIVSLVGAGGMGEVYRARDPRLRRDVAIKVLAGAVATDVSKDGERFLVLTSIESSTVASVAVNRLDALAPGGGRR